MIRVDHVADYKPPKDEEEEARKRKLEAGEEVCCRGQVATCIQTNITITGRWPCTEEDEIR